MQIYQIIGNKQFEDIPLKFKTRAWVNHPAVNMWRGYVDALASYYNYIRQEWINRGYKNTMPKLTVPNDITMPPWLGDDKFHASHRSNLLRKFAEHYSKFGWTEPNDMEYVWPVKRN